MHNLVEEGPISKLLEVAINIGNLKMANDLELPGKKKR